MPDYRVKVPKILWGAAFVNTLTLLYPLDNVIAGPEPRAGSESFRHRRASKTPGLSALTSSSKVMRAGSRRRSGMVRRASARS
jgi:hypothetical protein